MRIRWPFVRRSTMTRELGVAARLLIDEKLVNEALRGKNASLDRDMIAMQRRYAEWLGEINAPVPDVKLLEARQRYSGIPIAFGPVECDARFDPRLGNVRITIYQFAFSVGIEPGTTPEQAVMMIERQVLTGARDAVLRKFRDQSALLRDAPR